MKVVQKEKIFEKIYNKKIKSVIGFCKRYASQEEAEDLAHDIFLQAFLNLDKFRGESKIETWIYTISKNRCANFIRYKKRLKRNALTVSLDYVFEQVNTGFSEGRHSSWEMLKDPSAPNPLNIVIKNDLIDKLSDKVDKLSKLKKDLFLEYVKNQENFYKVFSLREGITINAIRGRINKIKKELNKKCKHINDMALSSKWSGHRPL